MIGRLLAYDNGPTGEVSDLTDPSQWLLNTVQGTRTVSGEHVTSDRAMTLSVFFACARNLAEDMAKLPLPAFRRLNPRGKRREPDHPVHVALNIRANPSLSAFTFRETMQSWATGGNAYAMIERRPRELRFTPVHPSRVQPMQEDNGSVFYMVYMDRGLRMQVDASEMFHLRGMGDALSGWSVIRLGAESIGVALATQRMRGGFFGNGAIMSGVLSHPGKLTPPAKDALRNELMQVHGSAKNAFKVMLLQEGIKYEKLGVTPEDAQMLETTRFGVIDICRWFRMPPHKVQALEDAHYNNVGQLGVEYETDTLMSWAKRWESEIQAKLFANEPDMLAEHTMLGILRADHTTRIDFIQRSISSGLMTRNEGRELENREPVDGGDEFYVPASLAQVDEQGRMVGVGSSNESAGLGSDQGGNPNVGTLQRAYARTIAHAASRFVDRERNALKRAMAKYKDAGSLHEWFEKFYSEQVSCVVECLSEPMLSMLEAITGAELSESVSARARSWLVSYAPQCLPVESALASRMDDLNSLAGRTAVAVTDAAVELCYGESATVSV